jgi:hypothetical protein
MLKCPLIARIKVILHIIWTLSTRTFFLFDSRFTGIPVWHCRADCAGSRTRRRPCHKVHHTFYETERLAA